MIFAGILAGGIGSRMEMSTKPKQFLSVQGIPIFIRTITKFLRFKEFDYVIVSINKQWESLYLSLLQDFGINDRRLILTDGGETRFLSLINIVKKANEICFNEKSFIVTHDCARIFVSDDIIQNNIKMADKYDMITTAIPVIDTILYSDNGENSSLVPDRSKLWNDQGPQTFEVHRFIKFVSMIKKEDLQNYIEAGKVFLSHNCKIGLVKGNRYNFKITNEIDLKYAEFLLNKGYIE